MPFPLTLTIVCLFALVCLSLVLPGAVAAQDATPTEPPPFPLEPGVSIEGNINDFSPVVRFGITGTLGDSVVVRLEATSGNLDPLLRLTMPDGETTQFNADNLGIRGEEVTLTIDMEGTIVVEATRSNFQDGGRPTNGTFRITYEILGVDVVLADEAESALVSAPDFGIEPAPQILEYRESGFGSLDTAMSRDYFTFAGEAGDQVQVIMTATAGGFAPLVSILNPNLITIGRQVQTRTQDTQEVIAYATLPRTGWYLIAAEIRDEMTGSDGAYEVYLDQLLSDARLSYGQSVFGEFSPSTPTTAYIFDARIQDKVQATLTVEGFNGNPAPELRLYNADFASIARMSVDEGQADSPSETVTLSAIIPRSGTYVLQANSLLPEVEGSFELALAQDGRSLQVSDLTLRSINYNDDERGFINDAASVSYYRFAGKATDRVTVDMINRSGDLDPFVILADSDLNELAANDNVSNTRDARIVQYQLPEDGDYIIIATRAGLVNGTTSGGFDVVLTVGEIVLEDGVFSAELQWDAAADLNLFVRDPQGRVVSWSSPEVPSGGELQIDSNTNCETPTDEPIEYIYWDPTEIVSGDYQIWAWYQAPCGMVEPVEFELIVEVEDQQVTLLEDMPPLNPGERFEVLVRMTIDRSVFVVEPGRVTRPTAQQDASQGGDTLIVYGETIVEPLNDEVFARFYQFTGTAGDEIIISAERVDEDLDPLIVLRDEADNILPGGIADDIDDGNRDALLEYTLPEDGRYIIAVSRYGVRDGTTNGRFRLTLDLREAYFAAQAEE